MGADRGRGNSGGRGRGGSKGKVKQAARRGSQRGKGSKAPGKALKDERDTYKKKQARSGRDRKKEDKKSSKRRGSRCV